jgi:hypothetical protein
MSFLEDLESMEVTQVHTREHIAEREEERAES